MALTTTKDHWEFLEEIEAPMWVDFMVETMSEDHDEDDKWFYTSHAFHQCSSRQLKAAFAHSGGGSVLSDFELRGSSSPNIPSSVSRSRGKHYAAKKWRQCTDDLSMNKQHPVKFLNGKSSRMNSGPSNEIKPKLSFVTSKGTSNSKLSKVSEKSFTQNSKETGLKAKSGHDGSQCSSSSTVVKEGESNTSNGTFESDHHAQQRNMEVSNRGFDHTSGLLSAVRNSLRKSFVTRKASRVEINNESKQLGDCKSSSCKSSVGSSLNPGHDVKGSVVMLVRNKEQTPDSRKVAMMAFAKRKNVKDLHVSKTSNICAKEKVSNSRRRGMTSVAKSAPQEAAKSKVQNQALGAKALVQRRGNEKGSWPGTTKAKEKISLGGPKKLVRPGKENTPGEMSLSQNCSSKGTKRNVPQKGDKAALVREKGKTSSTAKGKQPATVIQRVVYLR